jgi:hypothetical protein
MALIAGNAHLPAGLIPDDPAISQGDTFILLQIADSTDICTMLGNKHKINSFLLGGFPVLVDTSISYLIAFVNRFSEKK